jgi:LysM repeat protein
MLGSDTGSGHRRATGVVVGLLVAFVVAVPLLVLDLGGSDDGKSGTRSRAAVTTTAPRITTTTRGPVRYTVQAGDTLLSIAERFGVSTRVIMEANGILDPDNLFAGQVLRIPPVTPVRLVVTPRTVEVGGSIELTLTGAEPNESITFEIERPTGTFRGRSHLASSEGEVVTSYQLGVADPPGTYTVIATGDQITSVQATFRVIEPSNKSPE